MSPAPLAPNTSDEKSLAFTREDFAALAAKFRRESTGKVDILLGLVVVLLFLGMGAVASFGKARGWSESLGWGLLLLTWGLASIPMIIGSRWRTRLLKSLGLVCRQCGTPLVDNWRQTSRAEMVIATGACPHCSTPVFGEDHG